MPETTIRIENLGKSYLVGHNTAQRERYTALRDAIASNARSLMRRTRDMIAGKAIIQGDEVEEFWALKDVSFEVKQGETLGIIGRNGAGKSTLLKILSRITEPTRGRVILHGRVASLLEVGTGFHPELTGRENIFLNGAILGMTRAEIQRKFDEIVEFSGIKQFLDTPVKRFSSGMYVRLAFAVAAHLEPEILVVDEVLAVGDAHFQKKCLGKMDEVAGEGRTVLFVSHQMGAVQRLCDRVLVLNAGATEMIADTQPAIDFYLASMSERGATADLSAMRRSGNGVVRLTSFHVENTAAEPVQTIVSGNSVVFVVGYESADVVVDSVSVGFSLHDSHGNRLSVIYSHYSNNLLSLSVAGFVHCRVANFPFSGGRYYIATRVLVNGTEADWPKGFVGYLDVEPGDFFGSGILSDSSMGPVLLHCDWSASR
jgi:lipopolysaccharide transport system ATP-binding protein